MTTDAPSPSAELVLASAAALFVELLLIRWIGSEVRIFAYFQNLMLIACLLGFGLGFLRAAERPALVTSVVAFEALLALVAGTQAAGWAWGPAIVSAAFSSDTASIVMGAEGGARGAAAFVAAWVWTAGLFLGAVVVLHGYAQRIGAVLAATPAERRLRAYGWNLVGSLAGVGAFALLGALWAGPAVWVLVALGATLPLVRSRKARLLLASGALPALLLLGRDADVRWSPYQKLEFDRAQGAVLVNGSGYMVLRTMRAAPTPMEAAGVDRWRLPFTARPRPRSVLVVGAGGGNDVSAALRAGAERVVAVEIDPAILDLGRRWHPDRPYADPRVVAVIDDARHFAEVSQERFDLIVFSHLDAHGALSAYTNVRLDNYVHTVESFRAFRERLAPGGALYVSFQALQPWVAGRLRENLRLAFGAAPVAWLAADGQGGLYAHFLASDDPAVLAGARGVGRDVYGEAAEAAPTGPSTDTWPYLYVEHRRVPAPMLWIAAPLLALTGLTIARFVRAPGAPTGEDRHFFCLGAAFLLIEVHNVSRLALVFGTTWSVNAWVITGVLLVALGASVLAARARRAGPPRAAYAPLLALLAAGALVPLGALVGSPLGPALAVLLFSAPLFFAGLLFAGSLRVAADPARALGVNVLGSLVGGFLELASFSVGLPGLLWLALGLYALSWPPRR